MRYAIESNGTFQILSTEPATPEPGEHLVSGSLALLTAADTHKHHGPRTPGRSFVGIRQSDSARVVASPDAACGSCPRCRSGLGTHCETRLTLGSPGAPGALTEALILTDRQTVEIPEHVSDEAAACALLASIALQAAGRLHIREKPYATVIGAGAEAVLTAQALALASATVRVLSSSAPTLAACEKRGVRSRPTDDAGRRGDQDIVVICPGEPRALETALEMTAPRGRIVITPGASTGDADFALATDHEFDILGSRWAPIAEGLAAISDGRLDPAGLITKRVKIERAQEAMTALETGKELAVAVDLS